MRVSRPCSLRLRDSDPTDATAARSPGGVGRQMEAISSRRFRPVACQFGAFNRMIPGGRESGGGITDLRIKVSSHLTRRHSKERASAQRTKRRPLQWRQPLLAGFFFDLLLFLTLKEPFDTLKYLQWRAFLCVFVCPPTHPSPL